MIVLVGFMGAGKSTVGRALAKRLGAPFCDTDAVVTERAGADVRTIFASHGESGFRALEREVVAEVLGARQGVVALGGGAPEDPATLEALARVTTVHLEVSLAEALRRLEGAGDRPLLEGGDVEALFARRLRLYERASRLSVVTDGRTPDAIAEAILAAMEPSPESTAQAPPPRTSEPARVRVEAGAGYDVVIGSGVAARLDEFLPPLADAEKALIVTHPSLRPAAEPVSAALARAGLDVGREEVEEGEASKSLATAERLLGAVARRGLHRGDLVVGVGGGVVTDLAGYVASTYLRGIAVAHVATSLLAQVDAAIGGKTGVNLEYGKNLVGTIHQPALVVCDVDVLRTLARAELTSGMAEVVKYGLIAEPDLLDVVTARAEDILGADAALLTDLVTRSARIKGRIVSADERERGERAHLNYGHTFAHAIEHSAGYGFVRHGEAVAVGMMAAAHVARVLDRIDDTAVDAHARALSAVGLPTSARLERARLEAAWMHDKKYRRGVRFVLLSGLGKPEAGIAVADDAIDRALERLAA